VKEVMNRKEEENRPEITFTLPAISGNIWLIEADVSAIRAFYLSRTLLGGLHESACAGLVT